MMFARTDRLLLRPGWPEDASALATAIGDEAIVRHLADAPWPYRVSDAEAFLARPRDPMRPVSLIFARTLGSPRLIGCVGLAPTAAGDAQLGYWIGRAHWGLGYATEAAAAMVALAQQSLRIGRLVARHLVDNPASGNVLRKLGFRPTGDAWPALGYELDFANPRGWRAIAA